MVFLTRLSRSIVCDEVRKRVGLQRIKQNRVPRNVVRRCREKREKVQSFQSSHELDVRLSNSQVSLNFTCRRPPSVAAQTSALQESESASPVPSLRCAELLHTDHRAPTNHSCSLQELCDTVDTFVAADGFSTELLRTPLPAVPAGSATDSLFCAWLHTPLFSL